MRRFRRIALVVALLGSLACETSCFSFRVGRRTTVFFSIGPSFFLDRMSVTEIETEAPEAESSKK